MSRSVLAKQPGNLTVDTKKLVVNEIEEIGSTRLYYMPYFLNQAVASELTLHSLNLLSLRKKN